MPREDKTTVLEMSICVPMLLVALIILLELQGKYQISMGWMK